MAELDTYAVPQAHDPAFASGFGDLSVHEVATSAVQPDLAYYSYYAGCALEPVGSSRCARPCPSAAAGRSGGVASAT
jgi:hypothetical protein